MYPRAPRRNCDRPYNRIWQEVSADSPFRWFLAKVAGSRSTYTKQLHHTPIAPVVARLRDASDAIDSCECLLEIAAINLQPFNPSTLQPPPAPRPHQPFNTSTLQLFHSSTRPHRTQGHAGSSPSAALEPGTASGTWTFQPFHSSNPQPFNRSTLQPFKPSTLQPFYIQAFNPSTLA